MILRPARGEDAEAICAIHNPLIRDTLVTFSTAERHPEAVRADIAARLPAYIVAEVDGAVAGFATYGEFRKGPGYAATKEHTIILSDAARGRGIGRELMAELERIAIAESIHVLVGAISGSNPESIAFHARLGYVEIGRLPQVGRKFGQFWDLVLMQKVLSGQVPPDSKI